ncbi:ribosome hibernation-promoting factor, HPF/YfiA family [Solicola sp. PLA-1-18]|uniref:ribosome hibernation-promoting factor, HPF/YfiA family n=1 Tax=Solicola sp. PLA-1-18 TaxID=3380532 RepID=UPI003B813227
MEIVVKARHCEVTDEFRDHVHDKLGRLADKYDARNKIIGVDVEVTHERNPRQHDRACRVELTVRSRGPVIRAEASHADKIGALECATDKLEARLRRAVDRRRIHHGRHTPVSVAEAVSGGSRVESLLGALRAEQGQVNGTATALADGPEPVRLEGGVEVLGDGPLVVREKTHQAAPMTLDQALYEMEMVGHDFYLFIDASSGCPSVVYRRQGYDYGVIHLDQTQAPAEA